MSRHHHAGNPRSISASQHGAEVSRVGYPVTDQEKGLLHGEKVVEAHGVEGVRQRHDALVTLRLSLTVQAGHGDQMHRYSLSLSLELNRVQRGRRVLGLGDEDLLDG